jgi:alginate O-acetyltransferase complex protein AlgI
VMLLGGLWHGANWTFVLWGGYHGLLLAYERWRGKQSAYQRLPRPARIGITFVLMLFSWVLFRAEDLTATIGYFAAMFGLRPASTAAAFLAADIYTPLHLTVMALCAVLAFQSVQAHDWVRAPVTWPRVAFLVPVFVLSLLMMFTQAFNPFLYFQF